MRTTRTIAGGTAVGVVLLGGLLVAPSADAMSTQVVKTVQMTNGTTFMPKVLTIRPGTTVTWHNGAFVTHTTTSNTGLWKATVAPGHSYSRVFTRVGTFRYRCTIHAGMVGTIVVKR